MRKKKSDGINLTFANDTFPYAASYSALLYVSVCVLQMSWIQNL